MFAIFRGWCILLSRKRKPTGAVNTCKQMFTLKEVIKRLEETTDCRSFKIISHSSDLEHCEVLVQDKVNGWFKCVLSVACDTGYGYAIYQVVNGEERIELLNAYNEALRIK